MPLKVQKQGRESSQSIVRRFTQKLRRSGILVQVRKNRFRIRKESAQLQKRSALRREMKRQEYQELKKLGKV